jgi:4-amino-4-deoxy-L-arabinose transferase-like glycosyltransferase
MRLIRQTSQPTALKAQRWIIALLLLVSLAPFADKAVHIDDPLFIWPAVWLQSHWLNFYDFNVNWFGFATPMGIANYNPPLTAYLLALTGGLFGWNEMILHGAFLLVALAAALGIYQLALEWSAHPLLATIIAIFMPVFFISSTTLMCDMPMLALSVWAVVFWEKGLRTGKLITLLLSGALTGLAVLAKYTAISFVPLLLLIGILRQRKAGLWLLGLCVPLLMLAGFELWTAKLYGRGLFAVASEYAAANRWMFQGGWAAKMIIGLAFLGGCLLPMAFFAPLLWRSRTCIVFGFGLFGLSLGAVLLFKKLGPAELSVAGNVKWALVLQLAVLITAGLHTLLLTAVECWLRRDAVNIILAAWILGTFVLAALLNWTVSARSFLPIVPAAAILLVRRLKSLNQPDSFELRWLWPLIPSAAFALLVALADFRLANSARAAALQISTKYLPSGAHLSFQGHWGFQYYMQNLGVPIVDFKKTSLQPGDILVLPSNNTNISPPPLDSAELLEIIRLKPCSWLTTMHSVVGAGFYAADWGPLPFAFGRVPAEEYTVIRMTKPVDFQSSQAARRGVARKIVPEP